MAEPVEVQRYELALEYLPSIGPAPVIDPGVNGALCKHADIAPLLAELADLRERTRMRPPTDESHGNEPVLVQYLCDDDGPPAYAYEVGRWNEATSEWLGLSADRYWAIRVTGWVPLPEVTHD